MIAFTIPRLSLRALSVWRRNFLVWRKLAIPSMLGNLADPMIYMFGLGYGLGALLPEKLEAFGGVPYIAYLASGTICASTMNAATFEALYSAFSRMQMQKTWDALLNAPLALDDVLAGEWLWAASKSTLSGTAILLVMTALGFIHSPLALAVLPVVFLAGLTFAGLGLIINALAPSYDFFMYYFTLAVTPMILLSGVFFPMSQLPVAVQNIASILPLAHVVALVRPLVNGQIPTDIVLHLIVLMVIAASAFTIALALTRRRLLN